MHHGKAVPLTSIEQIELALEATSEARQSRRSGEAGPTAQRTERSGDDDRLMEQVVERSNLARALKRVRQNQGSAGIDGMGWTSWRRICATTGREYVRRSSRGLTSRARCGTTRYRRGTGGCAR